MLRNHEGPKGAVPGGVGPSETGTNVSKNAARSISISDLFGPALEYTLLTRSYILDCVWNECVIARTFCDVFYKDCVLNLLVIVCFMCG